MSTDNILKLLIHEDAEARRSVFANAGLTNTFEKPPKSVLAAQDPGSVFIAVHTQFVKLSLTMPTIQARLTVLEQGWDLIKCISLFLLQTRQTGDIKGLHTELMQLYQQSSPVVTSRTAFTNIFHQIGGIHVSLAQQKQINNNNQNIKQTPAKSQLQARPASTNATPSQQTIPICGQFNAGACTYSNCKYGHVCQICRGKHPRISCPSRTDATAKPQFNNFTKRN